MLYTSRKQGFTLIETMLGILIVSIVMVGAFQALTAIGIGKIRLIQNTNTQKQSLYFSEKLFEMIKKGGTLDYEEYFNRNVVNLPFVAANTYQSGHYIKSTGFGNFGPGGGIGTTNYQADLYPCISPSGSITMGSNGCYSAYLGDLQTYGEYSFQFIDYNSDLDGDTHCSTIIVGDQNCDGNVIGDDDDEYLGEGPDVFTLDADTKELYLIDGTKRGRTLFRYNVKLDPDRPPSATCDIQNSGETFTGTGCIGTIEYLQLEGKDRGLNHIDYDSDIDGTEYDGVIDTWLIDEKFSGNTTTVAHSYNTLNDSLDTNDAYRQPLFPDNINVTEFKVYPHPNIDLIRAWRVSAENQNVAQYVRIQLGMKPAWKDRKMLDTDPEELKFSTTINLTDIFTQ